MNHPQSYSAKCCLIFKDLAGVYGKIKLVSSYDYPQFVDKTRSLRILQKYMLRLT